LAIPSRWYEAQGLMVLEARSYGMPAFTSDSLADFKLIEDGVTGMLFMDNDLVDLKSNASTYHQFFIENAERVMR